ncbi:MAG TPA: hypothetical protein VIV60_21580 [Polyangiaceae bacterium]
MTIELLDRYRVLMNELLFTREAEAGDLPEELESSYVERLEDLWWQLSESEQAAYEAELTLAESPSSPEELNFVDCTVTEGGHASPRRAA